MVKKMLNVLFISFTVLLLVGVTALAYHGFFSTPAITEKEVGPYLVAVKRFTGSYYKVGPTMTEVDTWLRENGVNSTKGVGLYYDDPAKVPEDQRRSDVGNILEGVDEQTLEKIKEKFTVIEIKKSKAAVVDYPIKSPLSYMLAPMKVYPEIAKYWTQKGYEEEEGSFSIEIYDIPNKVTSYIIPVP
jgi:DNA gyrase inhibitor GyrI